MKLENEIQVIESFADGKLLAGRIENVGVMLFNQPEKRNAVSLEMWDGVCNALDLFAGDSSVRIVIYAGAGDKAFTAGNDISQFAGRRDNADANAEFMRLTGRGRERLRTFPKPSIACIQGFCLGGGMATALQADLRVASSDAVFGITAARLGLPYGIEPMEQLVSLVGPARARLILYSAKKFNAQEALAMGIVDVVAEKDVAEESLDLAHTIAANAPLSIQAIKFTVEQTLKAPSHRDLLSMNELTRLCLDSADYREGRTAFTAKRKPVFTGS